MHPKFKEAVSWAFHSEDEDAIRNELGIQLRQVKHGRRIEIYICVSTWWIHCDWTDRVTAS